MAELSLTDWLEPGDRIAWGQACAEPTPLLEALCEQASEIHGLEGFCGVTFQGELLERLSCVVSLRSYGAQGALRKLAGTGSLAVVPCHLSALPRLLTQGALRCQVAFVQVAPADRHGRHSFGIGPDYMTSVATEARVVIAEINERMPRTNGPTIDGSRIDLAIKTSRELVEMPTASPLPVDHEIAAHVAQIVEDGDVIEMGFGSLMDAVSGGLREHRNLRFNTGMISDSVIDLYESGAIEVVEEGGEPPIVTAAALGSARLFDWLRNDAPVRFAPVDMTHSGAFVGAGRRLVAINAALSVDLTGQIAAESVNGRIVGAVGGGVDFMRIAAATGGDAITVLRSRGPDGMPMIVRNLVGPVTTARSDAHIVVTEHGCADLRRLSLDERAAAMCAIAHPDDRASLLGK